MLRKWCKWKNNLYWYHNQKTLEIKWYNLIERKEEDKYHFRIEY